MANKSPTSSWEKGQSGNPKGRPKGKVNLKGKSILELRKKFLRELIELVRPEFGKIVKVLIEQALSGNIEAISLLFEYIIPKNMTEKKRSSTHLDTSWVTNMQNTKH